MREVVVSQVGAVPHLQGHRKQRSVRPRDPLRGREVGADVHQPGGLQWVQPAPHGHHVAAECLRHQLLRLVHRDL